MDWKIIATMLITLAIIIAVLSTQTDLAGFLDSIIGGLSAFSGGEASRNVSIDIITDYGNFSSKIRGSDITATGDNFSMETDSATYRIPASVDIINFTGAASVSGKTLVLDGTFQAIKIGSVEVSVKSGKMTKSAITFVNLTVYNLSVVKLNSKSASGSFASTGLEIKITSKGIDVVEPLGKFEFSDKLHITGTANRISILEDKISLISK